MGGGVFASLHLLRITTLLPFWGKTSKLGDARQGKNLRLKATVLTHTDQLCHPLRTGPGWHWLDVCTSWGLRSFDLMQAVPTAVSPRFPGFLHIWVQGLAQIKINVMHFFSVVV